MNFPGHNYLGPGNPVVNGQPVDSDDYIAQIHDLEYDSAENPSDIRSADRKAIWNFTKDAFVNHNWHSVVGATGLATKYLVESVVGVQYPRPNSLGKRSQVMADEQEMQGDEPSPKRQKTSSKTNEKHEPSIAADKETIRIHHPISNFKTGKLVFTHHRMLYSQGYQFKSLLTDKDVSYYKQCLVTTPYAYIPCDILPWYMTMAEFKSLPYNSKVKYCTTVCTPMGFRTPFITNSAGINSVNSNLFVTGMHAHGLNNKFHGVNATLTTTVQKPMVPTGYSLPDQDDYKSWYGRQVDKDQEILPFSAIPCGFGNTLPLKSYYCQNYDAKRGRPTVPELMQDVHIFSFNNGMNNPVISWEYAPQICTLNPLKPNLPFRTCNTSINYGCKTPGFFEFPLEFSGADTDYTLKTKPVVALKTEQITPTYWSYIEHAGSAGNGFGEYGGGLMPPSLHVGVLPVHSFSTNPSEDDIQEVTAIYKFDTMIEIEYSYDFVYAEDQFGTAHNKYMGDDKYIRLRNYHTYNYGYKGILDTTAIIRDPDPSTSTATPKRP